MDIGRGALGLLIAGRCYSHPLCGGAGAPFIEVRGEDGGLLPAGFT